MKKNEESWDSYGIKYLRSFDVNEYYKEWSERKDMHVWMLEYFHMCKGDNKNEKRDQFIKEFNKMIESTGFRIERHFDVPMLVNDEKEIHIQLEKWVWI